MRDYSHFLATKCQLTPPKKMFFSSAKKPFSETSTKFILSALKRSWIIIPVFLWAIIYLCFPIWTKSNPKYSTSKAESGINFIVRLDRFLFDKIIYNFIPCGHLTDWNIFTKSCILFVDIFCGIPYLIHFLLLILYPAWTLIRKRKTYTLFKFILGFGMVNLIGVLIQWLLPTPPPWSLGWKDASGTVMKLQPEGNFARVDSLLGFNIFKSIYRRNKITMGAFPSLHISWPSAILFTKPWIGKWFCWVHVVLIGFAAVWSMHHWILDILVGFGLSFLSCKMAKYLIQMTFPPQKATN
jgi:hypothetical protein